MQLNTLMQQTGTFLPFQKCNLQMGIMTDQSPKGVQYIQMGMITNQIYTSEAFHASGSESRKKTLTSKQ